MPYIKSDAMNMLNDLYNWQPYQQKHFESRFTRFYEGYWLPERFGFDTRKVQYSSLILTNQMQRDDAIDRLKHPAYDKDKIKEDFEYIATKLGIANDELKQYFNAPIKSYKDYRNHETLFQVGAKVMKYLGLETSIKR